MEKYKVEFICDIIAFILLLVLPIILAFYLASLDDPTGIITFVCVTNLYNVWDLIATKINKASEAHDKMMSDLIQLKTIINKKSSPSNVYFLDGHWWRRYHDV